MGRERCTVGRGRGFGFELWLWLSAQMLRCSDVLAPCPALVPALRFSAPYVGYMAARRDFISL